jgi:phosphoenolpyruvate-protein kinase (PTS system EI component)
LVYERESITVAELKEILNTSESTIRRDIIALDKETSDRLSERKKEEDEKKKLLLTLKGKEDVTLDGQHVMLYANIGSTSDLAMVLKNDASGIGLFRSEFIYLGKDDFPSENEQFQIYKSVAETMAGRRVIIRTLDIGADKKVDYFNLGEEENPALGYRAIFNSSIPFLLTISIRSQIICRDVLNSLFFM